ncbi:MAG: hypothetical protein AB7S38_26185 [Vulcanimicrobiota bacterium]
MVHPFALPQAGCLDRLRARIEPSTKLLELSCGAGLASVVALRAGAEKAVFYGSSEQVEMARVLARDNNVEARFEGRTGLPALYPSETFHCVFYWPLARGGLDPFLIQAFEQIGAEPNLLADQMTLEVALLEETVPFPAGELCYDGWKSYLANRVSPLDPPPDLEFRSLRSLSLRDERLSRFSRQACLEAERPATIGSLVLRLRGADLFGVCLRLPLCGPVQVTAGQRLRLSLSGNLTREGYTWTWLGFSGEQKLFQQCSLFDSPTRVKRISPGQDAYA